MHLLSYEVLNINYKGSTKQTNLSVWRQNFQLKKKRIYFQGGWGIKIEARKLCRFTWYTLFHSSSHPVQSLFKSLQNSDFWFYSTQNFQITRKCKISYYDIHFSYHVPPFNFFLFYFLNTKYKDSNESVIVHNECLFLMDMT